MVKPWSHPKNELILASYLPYKVQVQWHKAGYSEAQQGLVSQPITGTLTEIAYNQPHHSARAVLRPEVGCEEYPLATELLPVLYALEDLPKLPGRALESVVRLLEIIGYGHQLDAVHVVDSWLNFLRLEVTTSEVGISSETRYRVLLFADGNVWWRQRGRHEENDLDEVALSNFRPALGHNLFDAFERLRNLHVAVGHVAAGRSQHNPATGKPTGEPEHYVRKQLPVQEGGEQQ